VCQESTEEELERLLDKIMVLFRFIHGMSLASFVICVYMQQQKQRASCRSLQASQIFASCQLINPSSVVRWLELRCVTLFECLHTDESALL